MGEKSNKVYCSSKTRQVYLESKIEQKYKVINGAETAGCWTLFLTVGSGYQELGSYVLTVTKRDAQKIGSWSQVHCWKLGIG